MHNLLLNQGYNQLVSTGTPPGGQDAGGDDTFPVGDFDLCGVATILPAQPSGQQIDAIHASSYIGFGPNFFGVRVVVLALPGNVQNMQNFLTAAPLWALAAFYQSFAVFASGLYVPDPASGIINPFLPGVANAGQRAYNAPASLRCALDVSSQDPSAAGGELDIDLSSRPGGGIILGPSETGAVLAFALRAWSGNPVTSPVPLSAYVGVSAHGGNLAPGQDVNGSNTSAPRSVGRAVPRAGAAVLTPTPTPTK